MEMHGGGLMHGNNERLEEKYRRLKKKSFN